MKNFFSGIVLTTIIGLAVLNVNLFLNSEDLTVNLSLENLESLAKIEEESVACHSFIEEYKYTIQNCIGNFALIHEYVFQNCTGYKKGACVIGGIWRDWDCTDTEIYCYDNKGYVLYEMNLDNAKEPKGEMFSYSSLYKHVSIITLETKDDCLIGRISKIQVFDKYIFVLDANVAKSLFIFDREGKFIRKIGNKGNGPGEYLSPVDFTIDKDKKTVYILDHLSQRINKYDITTGRFIHAINLEKKINCFHIEYIDGKLYSDVFYRKHTNDNYLLRVIKESSGNEECHYLNVMKYNKGFSNTVGNILKKVFLFSTKRECNFHSDIYGSSC